MTDREKLELAAKACGYEIAYRCSPPKTTVHIKDGESSKCWNPLTDQAGSDRMACKLRIALHLDGSDGDSFYVEAFACVSDGDGEDYFSHIVPHNNTDEDVCRAVREARLMVAAEIGRGKCS